MTDVDLGDMQRRHRTELGYRRFRCRAGGGSTSARLQRAPLSGHRAGSPCCGGCATSGFRDVAELLLERGYEVTHETIQLGNAVRTATGGTAPRSRPPAGPGTSTTREGRRPFPRPGRPSLIGMLSEARQARGSALPPPRRRVEGRSRHHRPSSRIPKGDPLDPREDASSPVLNNFMEQDHRAVKQRYYPMRGRELRVCGRGRSTSFVPLAPRARGCLSRAAAALRRVGVRCSRRWLRRGPPVTTAPTSGVRPGLTASCSRELASAPCWLLAPFDDVAEVLHVEVAKLLRAFSGRRARAASIHPLPVLVAVDQMTPRTRPCSPMMSRRSALAELIPASAAALSFEFADLVRSTG